ncbi:hypothetical protein [Roseiconus lacunae]|uniref:hypothetical protein n=1 Tax=Roseiconus lacunae TaxID=2605694 RepID=UPI001E4DAA57|nr:hypothetical protein [Roseiconus lacunae]MCD0459534.1 hypothetical protein [Roseiconus lacunae]
MKTSKSGTFLRACVIVFGIYIALAWIWNSMTGTKFWTPIEMGISAVLTVAFFGGIAWLLTNIGMAVLCGRNPEYQQYRKDGGDPFFDSLPSAVTGGQKELRFECPVCSSPVQNRIDVCGRCGYGADGDSTAYFERYGDLKPVDLVDAKWAGIRDRRNL